MEIKKMRYISEDLTKQYDLYRRQYEDLQDLSNPMMNVSDVLRAYFILVDYFSDATAKNAETMLYGIRDMNLLISALGRQAVEFGGKKKYTHPIDICATLFFGLVKNHAFADGNKRTALLTLLYQLDCYGYLPQAKQKDFEALVVAVAANKLEAQYPKIWKRVPAKQREDSSDAAVSVIAALLRKMTRKKDNSFHIDVPARDFVNAINRVEGCFCEIDGDRIKIQRNIKRSRWLGRFIEETKTYMVPYRGDTRPITAKTTREALDRLELYDQFPNYQSFVSGVDPRYMLISQFEGPLRRLKDK